MANYVGFEK